MFNSNLNQRFATPPGIKTQDLLPLQPDFIAQKGDENMETSLQNKGHNVIVGPDAYTVSNKMKLAAVKLNNAIQISLVFCFVDGFHIQ